MSDQTHPDSAHSRTKGEGRGREADDPQDIPPRGWKDVLIRAYNDSNEKNISLVAGGVTYYVLIALFPGLAALISIYGLVSDPHQVATQVNSLSGMLVPSAQQLISSELKQLVTTASGTLSFGAIIGILIALYSASRGMSGMITAVNIAYGEKETRSFIKFNLLALVMTVGLVIGGIVILALVAVLPAALANFSGAFKWVAYVVEWPALILFMMGMLAVLYRYAPSRDNPQWQWTSPGAIAASVVWVLASILFSIYVAHFGNYNKTYGSLGAVIVLLTWLWLSAYLVLLGAEINGESERQTRKDTTVGEPEPMGTRDATAADTLGEQQGS